MMRCMMKLLILQHVSAANLTRDARDCMDKLTDELANKLLDRTIVNAGFHDSGLESTTLGKGGSIKDAQTPPPGLVLGGLVLDPETAFKNALRNGADAFTKLKELEVKKTEDTVVIGELVIPLEPEEFKQKSTEVWIPQVKAEVAKHPQTYAVAGGAATAVTTIVAVQKFLKFWTWLWRPHAKYESDGVRYDFG